MSVLSHVLTLALALGITSCKTKPVTNRQQPTAPASTHHPVGTSSGASHGRDAGALTTPSDTEVNSDTVPEGTAQGYVNGRPITLQIRRVDDKPVETHTAAAYLRMQRAAARVGVRIEIVSGFRTNQHQAALYRLWRARRGAPANPPGFSNHQSGHALDLNARTGRGVLYWLRRNAQRFGFRATVRREPWHWEWWP